MSQIEYTKLKIKNLQEIINKQQCIIEELYNTNILLFTSIKEANKKLRLCYETDIKDKKFNPHCYSSLCKFV